MGLQNTIGQSIARVLLAIFTFVLMPLWFVIGILGVSSVDRRVFIFIWAAPFLGTYIAWNFYRKQKYLKTILALFLGFVPFLLYDMLQSRPAEQKSSYPERHLKTNTRVISSPVDQVVKVAREALEDLKINVDRQISVENGTRLVAKYSDGRKLFVNISSFRGNTWVGIWGDEIYGENDSKEIFDEIIKKTKK